MRTINAAMLYFGLVFGAGFVLGIIRQLWFVPRFGARVSELLEAPIMLAVIVVAARWVTRRLGVAGRIHRLAVGILALGLLLLAEFTLVLWVRGLSMEAYFATRDPVAAVVYYLMLGIFAVLPWWVGRRSGRGA